MQTVERQDILFEKLLFYNLLHQEGASAYHPTVKKAGTQLNQDDPCQMAAAAKATCIAIPAISAAQINLRVVFLS